MVFKKAKKKAAKFKAKFRKAPSFGVKQLVIGVEDDIRDLINLVEVLNKEELEIGEGKKVEDDAAREIIDKLKKIAFKLGTAV